MRKNRVFYQIIIMKNYDEFIISSLRFVVKISNSRTTKKYACK